MLSGCSEAYIMPSFLPCKKQGFPRRAKCLSQYCISLPSTSNTAHDKKRAPANQVYDNPNFFKSQFLSGGGGGSIWLHRCLITVPRSQPFSNHPHGRNKAFSTFSVASDRLSPACTLRVASHTNRARKVSSTLKPPLTLLLENNRPQCYGAARSKKETN